MAPGKTGKDYNDVEGGIAYAIGPTPSVVIAAECCRSSSIDEAVEHTLRCHQELITPRDLCWILENGRPLWSVPLKVVEEAEKP